MNRIILAFIFTFNFLICHCQQREEVTRLGIPNFTLIANSEDKKNFDWLELGFSESLTDAFSRVPQFSVIERNQLNKILIEQQLQKTSKIDTTSIVKAGKLLGINLMLVGSCQIATGHALVNMRIVNVENGQVSHLKNLPIITPIDSILFIQKKICIEVLNQFNVQNEDKIIIQIEKATSSSTNSLRAYEFLNKGLELFSNNQYNEAIDMYTRALSIDKKYQKAYFKRAESKFATNQYSTAIDDYKNSDNYIRKDSVYHLISNAYSKQGLTEKSIEYLKLAKRINPANNLVNQKLLELEKLNIKTDQSTHILIENPETIFEFNEGIARIKKNKKYGFIDLNNKLIIPLEFDDLRDFKNGLAAAKIGSKWGFINSTGALIIEPNYTEVTDFDDNGLAKVIKKIKWGIINKTGKVIVPIEFENMPYAHSGWESSKFLKVCKSTGLLGISEVCGIYSRTGEEILPVIYDDISESRSFIYDDKYPYFHVSLNGKWGVVDRTNRIIIPFAYDNENCIEEFKNDFAAVKVNERWGFVNRKGILVIPTEYEKVSNYNGELFEVRLKGKWGAVDVNNNVSIPCEYEGLEYLKKGFYAAEKDNKWGIIKANNTIVCNFNWDEMASSIQKKYFTMLYDSKNHVLQVEVKLNGKTFWIDEKCKCILDCE